MTCRLREVVVILAALVAATACDSASSPGSQQESPAAAANGADSFDSGEDGPLEEVGDGSGVGERICAILTADEIGALVGGTVAPGELAGPLGSACSWDLPGDGLVLVQVTPPDFWRSVENPDDSDYRPLEGIGIDAFVQPGLVAGWTAAALFDDRMVLADVSGPTASPEMATRVLQGAIDQLNP